MLAAHYLWRGPGVAQRPWADGYSWGLGMRIPGATLGGPEADVETGLWLWFDETHPDLRSVANGGKVASALGWDIRFETLARVKWPHELEVYDPAAGRAAGWLGIPTLDPDRDVDIGWYIGNPSLAASEADPASVWRPWCYGSWRMPDGHDMTEQGRNLTMVGTIAGAPIFGMPTADWNQSTDYGNLDNPAFFDGATEWTALNWGNPSGDGVLIRFGGSVAGSATFTVWRESGRWEGGYKVGSANPVLHGPDGSASAGDMMMAFVRPPTGDPLLFRDGEKLTCTMNGTAAPGPIIIDSGEALRLGANPGSNPGAIQGPRGRLIIVNRALSAEAIRFIYRSTLDPRSCYGLGDPEQRTGDRSPLMRPVRVSCEPGASVDIPVAGNATHPEGATLTPAIGESPSQGTAVADEGKWTYRADATASGTDRFLARVTAGALQASAAITVELGDDIIAGPGGWTYTLANLPGGAVGSGSRVVVSGQTFRDTSWMKAANRDYVSCRIIGTAATDTEDIAKNIRLINCTVEDNSGHTVSDGHSKYIFYINLGQKELAQGFLMFGGAFLRCSGTEFFETKGFDPMLINVDCRGSPGITDGFRLRHGAQGMIVGCRGLKEITVRAHHFACVNNPESRVELLAGSLPSRIEDWLPKRVPGGGANWQRAEVCYVEGARSVRVGLAASDLERRYPALNNIIHPAQNNVTLSVETGTRRAVLANYAALQAIP